LPRELLCVKFILIKENASGTGLRFARMRIRWSNPKSTKCLNSVTFVEIRTSNQAGTVIAILISVISAITLKKDFYLFFIFLST
jgi:hypothetical protein